MALNTLEYHHERTASVTQHTYQKINPNKRRFVYLVNPVSGTGNKRALLNIIRTQSAEKGLVFEIMDTSASGNYDDLREKIEEEKITDIIIIGGDGTVNKVVASLYDMPVQFGIIPFGSGNGLANSAGIPNRPKQAFELILKGSSSRVDAFRVNDTFACMLSGLGFDAQVAHDFAQKTHRGLITYTQQSILNYFKAQPYQFEIKVDDISFFTDAFFISIANSNQFGNNFTIAPQASISDGLLDIVIVQKMNKAKLPFAILKQIAGNNKLQHLVEEMSNKNILYFQTEKIEINNLKLAPMHIDGEPVGTMENLKVEVIKNCFNLIH